MAGYYPFLVAKSAVSAQPRHATIYAYNVTHANHDELIGDGNEHTETLFNPGNWPEAG